MMASRSHFLVNSQYIEAKVYRRNCSQIQKCNFIRVVKKILGLKFRIAPKILLQYMPIASNAVAVVYISKSRPIGYVS
jgi:hypothetical protein